MRSSAGSTSLSCCSREIGARITQGSIRAGRDDGLRHGIDFFGNAGPVFLALGWRHVASNEAV